MSKDKPRAKKAGAIYAETRGGVKTGRYIGQLDLGTVDGVRRRRKVSGANPSEVQARIDELKLLLGLDIDVSKRPPTVAELAEQWRGFGCPRPGQKGKKSPSTLEALSRRLDDHVLPGIGRYRVDKLTVDHVEEWLAAEAAKGYRESTILDYRSDAAQLIEWAIRRNLIRWNPVSAAQLPDAAEAIERQILTRDERERLFDALVGDRHEAYFVLIGEFGLRPQEADALDWDHVDLEAGIISIQRAMKRGDGGRLIGIGDPKTKSSRRKLRMSARCVAVLRRHRKLQNEERLRAGRHWSTDERWVGLVFTSELGTPMHPSNVRRVLRATCKRVNLPEITTYSLRHTAATLLCEDLPLVRVKDVLGHKDTRMLERIYRHAPDVVEVAAEVEDRHHMRAVAQ